LSRQRAVSRPTLVIRLLGPDDVQAYRTLRVAVLSAHPSAFTSDARQERDRTLESYRARLDAARVDEGQFTLGAWEDATLIGAVSCERETRTQGRHVEHLVGMMVDSAYHGQGIGAALLHDCLTRTRAAPGVEMVTLSVTDGNAAAVHLYERAGFVRYGTLPRAIRVDGRYYAKHLMVLTL